MITTDRLLLRAPSHADWEFYLELLNDRSFIENIADRNVRTKEDAIRYIDKLLVHFTNKGYGFFLVADKTGKKLGMCGIIHRDSLPDPDIGFAFLPAHTGKGIALEAARAVMEKGMSEWGLKKISAIISPHNSKSIALVTKLGLVYDRDLRLTPGDDEVQYFIRERNKVPHAHNRFQALFQQTSIAIQIYNIDGKCVEVNDAWESLFHSKKKDLEGYNVLQDPQVHETGVINFFRRAFAGEMVHVPAVFYDPKKSGNEGRGRWLESIFTPVMNDEGVVTEVAIVFTDITDLKLARDQMRSIFDHMPESILVQDLDFNIVYANEMAVRTAGYNSLGEWLNKKAAVPTFDYLRMDGTPLSLDELPSRRALRGETSEVIFKFRNRGTGRERVSQGLARVVFDENGSPVNIVSVHRDITDKIRIETELREALESKNLFFSVASHELRTPITAMKLNTQLMNMTYPNISQDAMVKLDRQLTKLSKIVDEMLDISRMSRGNMELNYKEVNLAELTREVLNGFHDQLKLAGIPLTLSIPDQVTGSWDPDRLEQVVENLVTNAIRYARKSPLFVKLEEKGDSVILEVCDQGPGIPPEDLEKIFNRFERSRSFGERSGIGLGLYIVKEIVTLHGGTISVSNLNTGGARFLIELPRFRGR